MAETASRFVWSARRQWQDLPPERRRRAQELLRRSRGRPSALSPAERSELTSLIRELDLGRLVRDAATSSVGGRRRF
jgi:hypothetical protein